MYFKTDEREFSCIVSSEQYCVIFRCYIAVEAHTKFTLHIIEFTVANVTYAYVVAFLIIWGLAFTPPKSLSSSGIQCTYNSILQVYATQSVTFLLTQLFIDKH